MRRYHQDVQRRSSVHQARNSRTIQGVCNLTHKSKNVGRMFAECSKSEEKTSHRFGIVVLKKHRDPLKIPVWNGSEYGIELGSVTLKINNQQRESHVAGM